MYERGRQFVFRHSSGSSLADSVRHSDFKHAHVKRCCWSVHLRRDVFAHYRPLNLRLFAYRSLDPEHTGQLFGSLNADDLGTACTAFDRLIDGVGSIQLLVSFT